MYGIVLPVVADTPPINPDAIPRSGIVRVEWQAGIDREPGLYRILYLHSRTRRRLLEPWIDGNKLGRRPAIWADPAEFASVTEYIPL